jgi:hypothetical protein
MYSTLGLRKGADIRPLAVHGQIATGAALAKHARLDGLSGCATSALGRVLHVRGDRQHHSASSGSRLGAPCFFMAGALLTLRYRIDRDYEVFRARGRRRQRPLRPLSA